MKPPESPATSSRQSSLKFIKCCVSTIRKFDKSTSTKRKGVVFIDPWEGLSISEVEVRGVVVGAHAFGDGGGWQISLDDGTGRVTAIVWKIGDCGHLFNRFVSIQGVLVGFRQELQIRVENISVIATSEEPTEEQLWKIDLVREFEGLASLARQQTLSSATASTCPCMCHSASGRPCEALGKPETWPAAFVRAVAVINTAVDKMYPHSKIPPISELIENVIRSKSPSVLIMHCFPECATVEAARMRLRSVTCEEKKILQEEPKYPQTPFDPATQYTQKQHDFPEPKFRPC